MSRPLRIRPRAEADLAEAYAWYEEHGLGLGSAFLSAVGACLAGIVRNPEAWPVVRTGVRRSLVRRFPYGIYYVLRLDRIDVIAVYHVRRRPREWRP